MARNKKKKKKNQYRTNVSMLLVTMIVVCFACVMVYQMHSMRVQDNRYAVMEANLQNQVDEEEQRSEDLEESRAYVQTKKYIEDTAREKLGLVYPDESVVKARE